MKDGDGERKTIKSIENAFDIVELIGERGPLALSAVTAEVPQSKSTVHYYLETLEGRGYLERGPDGYEIGPGFLDLGGRRRADEPVYRAGRAEAERLASETGHSTRLGVERRGRLSVVYASIEGSEEPRTRVGAQRPLHCTALGKAVLAHLPAAEREDALDRHGLDAATGRSIADYDRLSEELARVRETGIAFEDEEWRAGVRAVAAPVFGPDRDRPVGAIGVSGEKRAVRNPYRGTKARRFSDDVSNLVGESADRISRGLETSEE